MNIIHPYVRRIRIEREVLGIVNNFSATFSGELCGLSADAINTWHTNMPAEFRNQSHVLQIVDKLMSIGALAKLSSNGSHRGAMVAPAPNEEIARSLIVELEAILTPDLILGRYK